MHTLAQRIGSSRPEHRLPRRFELEGRRGRTKWETQSSEGLRKKRPIRRIGPTLAREVNDALQVIRLREQIDQVHLLDPIAPCQQDYQIARQGYRIA